MARAPSPPSAGRELLARLVSLVTALACLAVASVALIAVISAAEHVVDSSTPSHVIAGVLIGLVGLGVLVLAAVTGLRWRPRLVVAVAGGPLRGTVGGFGGSGFAGGGADGGGGCGDGGGGAC